MLRILIVLTLLLSPSLLSASTNLNLLCEGKTQKTTFGNWEEVSTLFRIKDGTFKGKDTLGRKFALLQSGVVKMTDDEMLFIESGKTFGKIDRTTGQFTFAGGMKKYNKNENIKCNPQKKMF